VQTGLGALLPNPLRLGHVQVLGKMPNKTFKFQRQQPVHQAFSVLEVWTRQNAAALMQHTSRTVLDMQDVVQFGRPLRNG
jgi:hypothetical protein